MADDRLPKRAAELREQGRRDVRKVGEEEDWRQKKTRDRGGWKRLSDGCCIVTTVCRTTYWQIPNKGILAQGHTRKLED